MGEILSISYELVPHSHSGFPRRLRLVGRGQLIRTCLTVALLLLAATVPRSARAQALPADAQLPVWAAAKWTALSASRGLALSQRINPFLLRGDFDGDGQYDLAVLVEQRSTKKVGVVVLHRGARPPFVMGAGVDFGNGGDNFDWMDIWTVQDRTRTLPDALLLTKESSASGVVQFVGGRYRWKQAGD